TVGQRVITIGVTGTWQEYVVADAESVLPVPAGMSDSTAAQILANPLTAVILTGDELGVRPGEWLLQTAAGSTVGQSVIQLGAHVGSRPRFLNPRTLRHSHDSGQRDWVESSGSAFRTASRKLDRQDTS
ncbi:hypothetical protein P3H15_54765, partial [Rhodococcus sp. T2V]|nr:hypothetical protein [Rhodococcus sp. T2V]